MAGQDLGMRCNLVLPKRAQDRALRVADLPVSQNSKHVFNDFGIGEASEQGRGQVPQLEAT
eukprot:15448979-Alexandrium_andersonii.AAC.1